MDPNRPPFTSRVPGDHRYARTFPFTGVGRRLNEDDSPPLNAPNPGLGGVLARHAPVSDRGQRGSSRRGGSRGVPRASIQPRGRRLLVQALNPTSRQLAGPSRRQNPAPQSSQLSRILNNSGSLPIINVPTATSSEPASQPELSATNVLPNHANYMNKLFEEGNSSDFTVIFIRESFVNGKKVMKMHKIILCQMPYFVALFGQQWTEAGANFVNISISDENITERSLDIVFKSLYTGQLLYDKTEDDLISVMATARMFSLDDAADLISKVMMAIVSIENAVYFYYSFGSYGYPESENELFLWILRNFSYWHEVQHETFVSHVLSHIEEQFLEKLITNEDFIVKNEVTMYSILKRWLVDKMKLRENYDYFSMWNRSEPFLETDEGKEYERIFSLLNLHQLLLDTTSLEQLKRDNIYPTSYIHRACAENYMWLVQLAENAPIPGIVDFSFETYRVGIFHDQTATSFQTTTVNFFGIYLKFGMAGQMLTCTRNRHDKETLFHHAPVKIRFRVAFYTPEKFDKDGEYFMSAQMEHEIRENELVNLVEWKPKKESSTFQYQQQPLRNFGYISSAASPQAFNLIAQNNFSLHQHVAAQIKFPKIIGIEMVFTNRYVY